MLSIVAVTYVAVLSAELVGDKLLYTTGVLATRYRTLPVLCGMMLAFMAKTAVAVIVGQAIASLPAPLIAAVTAISFVSVAVALLRRDAPRARDERAASKAAMISFAAILFSEWADAGQIVAATLAARFGAPLAVWLGAVAALASKGAFAASFGGAIRGWLQRRVRPDWLRYGSAALLVVLGLLSVIEVFARGR